MDRINAYMPKGTEWIWKIIFKILFYLRKTKHQHHNLAVYCSIKTIKVASYSSSDKKAEAPGKDLFIKTKFQNYKRTNKLCAAYAFKAMNRHLWYLVLEIVLSLFDNQTILSVKANVWDACHH